MHPVYQQLCEDHRHIQRLVRCMRNLAAPLKTQGLDAERLNLMLDVMDYIKTYPEHWHHPIEDQVLSLLLLKHIPEADLLREVVCDHGRMEKQTIKLEQQFQAVAKGCVVPAQLILQQCDAYIKTQLDHIERENQWIYPLMERYLNEADWDWIAEKLPKLEDPLFGARRRADYQSLYDNIVAGEEDLLKVNY